MYWYLSMFYIVCICERKHKKRKGQFYCCVKGFEHIGDAIHQFKTEKLKSNI